MKALELLAFVSIISIFKSQESENKAQRECSNLFWWNLGSQEVETLFLFTECS